MRFKVDENLHADVAAAFRNEGYDALTVFDQQLQGSPNPDIASVCRREGRVLVTLDLDFANIREYPPENYAGFIVLRVANQSRPHVLGVISQVFAVLPEQPVAGHLWIVSESSVRIRSGTSADDSS